MKRCLVSVPHPLRRRESRLSLCFSISPFPSPFFLFSLATDFHTNESMNAEGGKERKRKREREGEIVRPGSVCCNFGPFRSLLKCICAAHSVPYHEEGDDYDEGELLSAQTFGGSNEGKEGEE